MTVYLLEPEQARRRQRRWQKALSLPVALVIVIAGYFLFQLSRRAAGEVKQMGPWPPPQPSQRRSSLPT
jgi:hypothetical protein